MCERLSCTDGRRKYGQQRLDSHAARRRWTHLARKHNRSEGALRRVVAHRDRRAASRHGPRRDRHDEGTRAREQKSEQEPQQHRASRNPALKLRDGGNLADDFASVQVKGCGNLPVEVDANTARRVDVARAKFANGGEMVASRALLPAAAAAAAALYAASWLRRHGWRAAREQPQLLLTALRDLWASDPLEYSFHDFMDDSLSHPAWGYYSSGRVGFGESRLAADFTTFPISMRPFFGAILADRLHSLPSPRAGVSARDAALGLQKRRQEGSEARLICSPQRLLANETLP